MNAKMVMVMVVLGLVIASPVIGWGGVIICVGEPTPAIVKMDNSLH